ncbi:FAD-dependent oxidoreductase [Pseudonocardiaceae bacterium YIM PH 21723]|nr:FAD-dependent oxidoreductase [Pseudonocardiaceae bacterium YIM PH 21723]
MDRYEVVVAGAGPVGLSTALFLADRGVRVLVVDKREPLLGWPRAGSSKRTLELFRAMGLGPQMTNAGWQGPRPMRTLLKESALGSVLEEVEPPHQFLHRLDTCTPVDSRLALMSLDIMRVALTELRRRGGTARFCTELTDFAQHDSGVSITLTSAEGAWDEVAADYLIGADGAHSQIREQLGIPMTGLRVADRLTTACFRADLGADFPEWRERMTFIRNDKVFGTLFALTGDGKVWSSHVLDHPGKKDELRAMPEAELLTFLHAIIGSDAYEIHLVSNNAWEARIGMAERYRAGRVFLAGDAAHVQSSSGGLGMNTGIQDGHNLAWKLAAVLRGQAGDGLLDSYQVERQQAAERSLHLSYETHRALYGGESMNAVQARTAADYLRAMMFYRYDSGAVIGDDGPDPDVFGDWAAPGYRLPHRWLTDELSTLDIVGTQWTLLTGPLGTGWDAVAGTSGVDLKVRPIGDSRAFTELARTEPDGALLVRPDGFVAWRAATTPADPVAAVSRVLQTVLGRP